MKIHHLKTHPIPFQAIREGIKNYEIRKNDRFFELGDELLLKEFEPDDDEYTGRVLHREIIHILEGGQYGVEEGYVILSIIKI